MITPLDSLFCIGLCAWWFWWRYGRNTQSSSSRLPHPPGPRGLPIVGNLRDLPSKLSWLQFVRWSQEYDSDIIRLNIVGKNIVAINSLQAATDIFEKRSSIYSDREQPVMLAELCGFGWGLPFSPYGMEWRLKRKAFHLEFHPKAVQKFRSIEERAAHWLLKNLLRDPENVLEHLHHQTASTIMKIAYDINAKEEDDPYVNIAKQVTHAVSVGTSAGSYLVDSLPFLKYLPEWCPGAKFKRDARIWKSYSDAMLNEPFNAVQDRMGKGDIFQCSIISLSQKLDVDLGTPSYMREIIKATVGSIYGAGADTTMSALGSFFLAMVLYPEAQSRAQQEIDSVLHRGRLPTFSDLPTLPYVEAIIMEVLRWNPVTSISVPHRSTEDDEYAGYFIPKGSLMIGNIWAILHDEDAYPDPSTFSPDRFMKDGTINREVRDPRVAAFGFGRRICPGRYMAFEAIWITVASILAMYSISKTRDKVGEPITPPVAYDYGQICCPKPFPCNIKPRSAEHAALIMALSLSE